MQYTNCWHPIPNFQNPTRQLQNLLQLKQHPLKKRMFLRENMKPVQNLLNYHKANIRTQQNNSTDLIPNTTKKRTIQTKDYYHNLPITQLHIKIKTLFRSDKTNLEENWDFNLFIDIKNWFLLMWEMKKHEAYKTKKKFKSLKKLLQNTTLGGGHGRNINISIVNTRSKPP